MSRLTGRLKLLSLLILAMTVCSARDAFCKPVPGSGAILGQVSDSSNGEPLPGASVALVDRYGGTVADSAGRFLLRKLEPGNYELRVSQVGYETGLFAVSEVVAGDTVQLDCRLKRRPIRLSGITVAPGTYGILEQTPATTTGLTRDQIETMPHLGEDLYRAINRLPGVSSGEFSTRFHVRGGEYDEVMVVLDGLRLYEPFHLKDVEGGAISIIDVGAVDNVKMMTGGFGAEYGDAMSGVLTIDSRQPRRDTPRYTAGLSLLNARFFADGFYSGGRGDWMVAARRGYFDLALSLAGEDNEIDPLYYDVFAKTRYRLSDKHILAAHILHAGDALEIFYTDDDADSLMADWNNSYAWLSLRSQLTEGLTALTVTGLGGFDHHRRGQVYYESLSDLAYRVRDEEDCRMATIRSDWMWELGNRTLISWGGEYRSLSTDFDYRLEEYSYYASHTRVDTTNLSLSRSGRRYAAFLSGRYRLTEPLTAEVGLRYDRATHTGGEHLSPRANIRYDLASNASLRVGWGYFYQSQEVSDLPVIDADTLYQADERAEHWVAGLQWDPHPGYSLRMEAYYKRYRNPADEYRNIYETLTFFPEAEWDRALVTRSGSSSRGIEVFFSKDNGGKLAWWLSYALARAEDDIEWVRYDGVTRKYHRTVPALRDQEHTLYLDLAFRPTNRWQLNLACNFHTGWPYTARNLLIVTDSTGRPVGYQTDVEYWDGRVADYLRVDIRVNRHFKISNGHLTAFAEIINLFDRENVRRYDTDLECGPDGCYFALDPQYWFGLVPSFGVTYSWSF